MAEPTIADVLKAVADMGEALGSRIGQIDSRMGQFETRLTVVGREQTSLRTDLMAQMERVLDRLEQVRTDVQVAVHFASRADQKSNETGPLLHVFQKALNQLRTRVERLEGNAGS